MGGEGRRFGLRMFEKQRMSSTSNHLRRSPSYTGRSGTGSLSHSRVASPRSGGMRQFPSRFYWGVKNFREAKQKRAEVPNFRSHGDR
eukprot:10015-Amorphochlora_amoeboformis.AAC.1